jgi:hypothetical protein
VVVYSHKFEENLETSTELYPAIPWNVNLPVVKKGDPIQLGRFDVDTRRLAQRRKYYLDMRGLPVLMKSGNNNRICLIDDSGKTVMEVGVAVPEDISVILEIFNDPNPTIWKCFLNPLPDVQAGWMQRSRFDCTGHPSVWQIQIVVHSKR